MKAQIVIFNGFDELDAIGPFEVMKYAASVGADLSVELSVVGDTAEITGAHGLVMRPHSRLAGEARPDLLVVPGGNWNNPAATQGVRAEVQDGSIPALIASLHDAGTLIAGVCTGAMLIAASGRIADRHAVTNHAALGALASVGAEVVDARVVDDGNIITSGGVTSGLDLALWLLERFFGPQIARRVEVLMEYERRGTVWRIS